MAAWRGLCNDVVLQVHAQQGACTCILHVNLSRTQGHYTTSCRADHLQYLPVLLLPPHLLHIVAQPGTCFPCASSTWLQLTAGTDMLPSNAVATGDMRILEISTGVSLCCLGKHKRAGCQSYAPMLCNQAINTPPPPPLLPNTLIPPS